MINPEEKRKDLEQKMFYLNELLERLNKATEADEQKDLQKEIEHTYRAMRQDIKDGNAALARKQEIDEHEFHERFASSLGREEAEELWKSKKWETKHVLRDMAFVLMQEPEKRRKIEEKGFNLEDIIRLNSNLLPNAENAVIDIRKLRDYSLNRNHPTGKDKARLFSSILGMTAENAEELRQIILEKLKTQEVSLNRCDEFGQRYTLDFTLEWQNRSGIIRTGWIIEPGFDIPRLTSCYPLL
ncbi:DUF6883 domain-containing protein [Sphaerospermopsis torques-reginae]|uniref:DUF6883 domain-containing protein n=1 Tax=Sphaerospermopsis torques-reginae TaxID=984207 RepID=UPI001FE83144|nr:DUF6883 domain-containing protein [Sphaerospermopsis torques-reginae]